MNREDIIRMAREAGAKPGFENYADLGFLMRFAELVAAAERKACADVDFRHVVGLTSDQDFDVSQALLARGRQ